MDACNTPHGIVAHFPVISATLPTAQADTFNNHKIVASGDETVARGPSGPCSLQILAGEMGRPYFWKTRRRTLFTLTLAAKQAVVAHLCMSAMSSAACLVHCDGWSILAITAIHMRVLQSSYMKRLVLCGSGSFAAFLGVVPAAAKVDNTPQPSAKDLELTRPEHSSQLSQIQTEFGACGAK